MLSWWDADNNLPRRGTAGTGPNQNFETVQKITLLAPLGQVVNRLESGPTLEPNLPLAEPNMINS